MHSRSKTRVSNFLFFSGRCHKFLGILIAWVSYYGLLQALGSQILEFLIEMVSNFDLFQKGGSQILGLFKREGLFQAEDY